VFSSRSLGKEILESIVNAGRFAATARNVQPWEFVVITKKDTLEKISAFAENGRFIASAAAGIAVFCKETKYYLEDGCAATENILLAATSYGVGSCWIAGDKKPYAQQVNQLLHASSELKLISLIALGYPEQKDALPQVPKRPLEGLIHWERFGV